MPEELTLKDFFTWWLEESKKEFPTEVVRRCGLCISLRVWQREKIITSHKLNLELSTLIQTYVEENNCKSFHFPFGSRTYVRAKHTETQHKNKKRRAFVLKCLKEL